MAVNYQANLPRVAFACLCTALIFSLWADPVALAIWGCVGVAITAYGDRNVAAFLRQQEIAPADGRRWAVALVAPRLAFILCWVTLLIIGWDASRPASFLFPYLYVMATLAQNVVTSSVYTPMLVAETLPKVLGALAVSSYWWATGPDDTEFIFVGAFISTLFYMVFTLRMARDMKRAAAERLRDKIKLRRAMRIVRAASDERGELLAAMSHEIRNPLGVIAGLVSLIRSDRNHENEANLAALDAATRGLLAIVNGVLDVGIRPKSAAGHTAALDVRATTGRMVRMLGPRAKEKGVTLVAHHESDVPTHVETNVGYVHQVLLNITTNAVEYTVEGSVTVAVSRVKRGTKHHVRWEVRDTGPGMPQDELARVFQRHERGQTSAVAAKPGAGLGLAICKDLAALLNGDVGATSAVGSGSTFWFELPIRSRSPATPAPTSETNPPPRLRPLTLILADDNALGLRVMSSVLTDNGHRVIGVRDSQAAIRAVASHHADAVLMDIEMPTMDGFDAAAAIRELPGPKSKIPIVALTGISTLERDPRYLAAGFDGIITKPMDIVLLAQLLDRLIDGATGPSTNWQAPAPTPRTVTDVDSE